MMFRWPIRATSLSLKPRRRLLYANIAFICSSSTTRGLNIALLTGSTRTDTPPGPILAPRIASFVQRGLERRGNITVSAVVEARDLELLRKPHFCYAPGRAPPELEKIYDALQNADGYVCVTPEYNHAPCPGLVNVLNHFGSSTFSFKPSAIVSYSAGQWGGTRAAISMRSVLSELGCLPVSAMIHIPRAHEVLGEDGVAVGEEEEKWQNYCDRCFSQLEWWAEAAVRHRETVDPFAESPSFVKDPDQRNAP